MATDLAVARKSGGVFCAPATIKMLMEEDGMMYDGMMRTMMYEYVCIVLHIKHETHIVKILRLVSCAPTSEKLQPSICKTARVQPAVQCPTDGRSLH